MKRKGNGYKNEQKQREKDMKIVKREKMREKMRKNDKRKLKARENETAALLRTHLVCHSLVFISLT